MRERAAYELIQSYRNQDFPCFIFNNDELRCKFALNIYSVIDIGMPVDLFRKLCKIHL